MDPARKADMTAPSETLNGVPEDHARIPELEWQLQSARNELESVKSNLQLAKDDWGLLNDFLNTYAQDESLCGDYERRLEDWNSSFKLLELAGRYKYYDVEVIITAKYRTSISVRATSPAHAKEEVNEMSSSDVQPNDWTDPYDYEWTVLSAEVDE